MFDVISIAILLSFVGVYATWQRALQPVKIAQKRR